MGLIAMSSLMLVGRYVSDDRIRMVASADHCQLGESLPKQGRPDGKVLFQYMAIIFLIKSHGNLHISG